MKKFIVESRRDYKETYKNYYGDVIQAETEEEAIELYKKWLIENHYCHNDIEEMAELYKEWLIENDYGPDEIEEEIDLYEAWLIERDYEPIEIEEWQYQVTDYDISNGDGGEGHDKARCY